MQGGAYIGHPPLRPFKVRIVNTTHPITQGINDFIVNDEQHYVEYDKDKKYILMESENIDGLTYQKLGDKISRRLGLRLRQRTRGIHSRGTYDSCALESRARETAARAVQWLMRELS